MKATGYELSGLMTQDEPLRQALTPAGNVKRRRGVVLPLDARQTKQTDSAIADLRNIDQQGGDQRLGGVAASLCPPTIPWAHLILADGAVA